MTPELLLTIVAVINAIGANAALLIHALRVPYRESSAKEEAQVLGAQANLVEKENGHDKPPRGSA